MQIYVVQPGDNIDLIAYFFKIPVETIIYDNQLTYPYRLAVGQALLIRTNSEAEPVRSVSVNGYAYPFIDSAVLEETLLYLSFLSVFSYGFTTEGSLLAPNLDDSWMIERAWNYRARPILVLTPLGEDGNFSNYLIHLVINDKEKKNRLIQELLFTIESKGYAGVDIDFEYILAEDKNAFVQFVLDVSRVMGEHGYETSIALAPKTEANQPGLLYEGKDYKLLGAAVDRALLMTYEWGYTYGPPMAVAPLPNVRRVVEYAITEISPTKIDLGIPNYGYDWALPYERGVTKARTISNIEAVQIAIQFGVPIEFDTYAQSPFFHYMQDGVQHEVWFEDIRSLQRKFDLVRDYGLHGMGYWQIMRLFRANWILLESEFEIQK